MLIVFIYNNVVANVYYVRCPNGLTNCVLIRFSQYKEYNK